MSQATTNTSSQQSLQSKILVRGGKPLQGSVKTFGAKNDVLKLIAACILVPDEIVLHNVPPLTDVMQMVEIARFLGGKIDYNPHRHILKINFKDLDSGYAPYDLVSKLRASFVTLGPILSRLGHAKVSLPGGCQIGSRRINLHEKGLKLLGAELQIVQGYVEAEIPNGNRLQGNEIYLDIPSNGATENLMMASVLAEGTTIIKNAAKDPEIEDLANFLNHCGAKISGAGTQTIVIEGVNVNELHGCEYSCLPDRIEAGTFLLAGLATNGDIIIENVIPEHLSSLLNKLKEIGAHIGVDGMNIRAYVERPLQGTEISTVWYPGFATDLQPQITSLLTKSHSPSIVKETIYEDRFSHVEELQRMGADIKLNNNTAYIQGVNQLTAAQVAGSDLRATAGLIIAGLMAEGVSEISGLEHLDRGYSQFTEKLASLGAEITRV